MRFFGRDRRRNTPEPAPTITPQADQLRMLLQEVREIRLQLDFVRTRIANYVGDGIALTYLADETPLFVNANDIGAPFGAQNGGRYEEENLEVLLSFVRDDTVFLDIGANIGIYTLRVGRRVPKGKVYAFEPNPQLHELLSRNAYVNGLTDILQCFRLGLSDHNRTASFHYPKGHLGGGHVDNTGTVSGPQSVEAEIRRLDDLLALDFRCDLVKIDVEGHELNVLHGMTRIIENSPSIKILFEKLERNASSDAAVEDFFARLGFELYGVQADASLVALGRTELGQWGGYVFAVRPGTIEDGLRRARFSLYPGQLFKPDSSRPGVAELHARDGERLFHGPYWLLPAGVWRLKLHGEIRGTVCISILERFGHPVLDFLIGEEKTEHVFAIHRDLVNFECAAYAASPEAEIGLQRLEFIREG
jgi:FkbM family methyltransferase